MRKHVIFTTASPVKFVVDPEVPTVSPVIVADPTGPELPKAIEMFILANCNLILEMKETAAELKRVADAAAAILADLIEQDTNEYGLSWNNRRLSLAQGHPRPIYWNRIRSNPG